MLIKSIPSQKFKVISSDDVYAIMPHILTSKFAVDQYRESFWLIGLTSANHVLFTELICLGPGYTTIVNDVFISALKKRAVAIIVVHNHPGSNLTPSAEDKCIAEDIVEVGKICRTSVLDYLIVSERDYVSLADIGILEEIRESQRSKSV